MPILLADTKHGAMRAGSIEPAPEKANGAPDERRLDPHLLLRLARIYQTVGKTTPALDALERGLALAPDQCALRAALRTIDRRGRPSVRFLSRSHPINVRLGRLRAWRSRRCAQQLSRMKTDS